jgi:alcohol dehydrogenase
MMKAWRLEGLGGKLTFEDVPVPEVQPGSVLVRIQASPLLSYLKDYVDGRLPFYNPPPGKFTPGTNGVGVIESVGRDVWHLEPGQRVVFSPHFVAAENVTNPAQILIGLTAFGESSAAVQADWRDGSLAEYALAPVTTLTPTEGLGAVDAAQLAVLNRFIVPFGGILRGRLAAGETLVVNGASGAYGSAAVLLGIAMGASRVIAVSRNQPALEAVANAGGVRVVPVRLTGEIATDVVAIRKAAGGPADMAFDMVGQANDARATLTSLHSLRRGGRVVLMGSMTRTLAALLRRDHAQ